MEVKFFSELNPSKDLCNELARLNPINPFYSPSYIESRRILGYKPLIFSIRKEGKLINGCPAFVKLNFLNCTLSIESLPYISNPEPFFKGILNFCDEKRISLLRIDTCSCEAANIPTFPGEKSRIKRWEYIIDLQKDNLFKTMRRNHRRNIQRATKAGLSIISSLDEKAFQGHIDSVTGSIKRQVRKGKGFEMVNPKHFASVTKSGAAELFQAIRNDEVMSSGLVILSEKGAYYYWAGATESGMSCGAAHFLVYEIAKRMRERGMIVFNLGGNVEENKSLTLYKLGFGTTEISLECAEFILGNMFLFKVGKIISLLKENPSLLFKRIITKMKNK